MSTIVIAVSLVVVILFGLGALFFSLYLESQEFQKKISSITSSLNVRPRIVKVGGSDPSNSSSATLTDLASTETGADGNAEKDAPALEFNTIDFFLTARNSQGIFRVGWGLYAATIGSSVLFAPSAIIADPAFGSGYLGLIAYALATAVPVILAAYIGNQIRQLCPDATSIGSFARWRYGRFFEIFIALQVLLNVGIALAAEYTAVGDLFSYILGSSRIWPVVVIGSITMIYTAAGGLYVSILTDQYQSIFSLLLLVIVSIYFAISFRIPGPLPELPPQLGASQLGAVSFFTLGISLLSSTLMSDAIWQRVWSAKDSKSLKGGAWIAGSLSGFMVLYFGLAGFMATWIGASTVAPTAFFSLVRYVATGAPEDPDSPASGTPAWILLLVCLIAVTMNESAVDSFQNALTDTLLSIGLTSGHNVKVIWARLAVLIINLPLMIVGFQGYSIASLYLITNLLTSCTFIPLFLGLLPSMDTIFSGNSALFGSCFGIIAVGVHGWIIKGNLRDGLQYNFFDAGYDWPAFVVGIVGSVVGMFLAAAVERCVYRFILKRSMPVPQRRQV